MAFNDFITCYKLTNIAHFLYNSKVKSFKIPTESKEVPQTFNLNLIEAAEVSISFDIKNWRFNRG